MPHNNQTLVDRLISGIPQEHRYVVEAIIDHCKAQEPKPLAFEVAINIKSSEGRRVSSFLYATDGTSERETKVNEEFARWLLISGVATERKVAHGS